MCDTDTRERKEQAGGGRDGIHTIVRASVLNGDFINRASEYQVREMGEVPDHICMELLSPSPSPV